MMKWLFKWLVRLLLLAVVLVVVLLLSLNSLLRLYVEHEIRARTGMDAEIGRFSLGLTEPTVTIQNLQLYNPPDFGGTPFLNIPEIHVEYDPVALAKHEIHLTLLRFKLGELDIVENQAGQTNIFALAAAAAHPAGARRTGLKARTGYAFTGIDVLNVSIGTVKFIDLRDQRRNRARKIGIENLVLKNVKSPNDLGGLELLIALRGGDFFSSLVGKPTLGHQVGLLNLVF